MQSMDLLWVSFGLGCVFGVFARLGRFCLLRGLGQATTRHRSEQPGEGAPALQAFALALAVGLVATQALDFAGQIDLERTLPMRATFSPLGVLAGGLMFGIGMALARACGARALVLMAGGNLRCLWVILWLGLTAQASMTGILAQARQYVQGWKVMTPPQSSVWAWVQANWLPDTAGWALAVAVPTLVLLLYAFWKPALRRHPLQLISALIIGGLVAAGWWISAQVGVDPFAFEDKPLTSLSFISPVAEGWLYLQLAVGRELSAAAAMVGGVLAGSFVVALLTRSFRWEVFEGGRQMLASAIGGILMGFGGVVAMGCSIGQGLSGLSTLALASFPAVAGIVIGACGVIQWQKRS